MDHNQIFAISAQGMSLERTRVEVAALNLANANTLVASDGSGFRPLSVVARQVGVPLGRALNVGEFSGLVGAGMMPQVTLEASTRAPRQVQDPGHPQADARGFVYYPAVDTAAEMMTVMHATRSYEANVAAMNAARAMAQKALSIGGRE